MRVLVKLQSKMTDTLVQILTATDTQQTADLKKYIESYDADSEQLVIVQGGRTFQISKHAIIAAEITGRQLTLYTSERSYQTKIPLHRLIEQLNVPQFIAVSKHAGVNVLAIRQLSIAYSGSLTAQLVNGQEIQIARRYVSQVRDVLKNGGSLNET